MTKVPAIRMQLTELVRMRPFRPFFVIFESGDRAMVVHPENVAFDPLPEGRDRIVIFAADLVHHGTLSAITKFVELDVGQPVGPASAG